MRSLIPLSTPLALYLTLSHEDSRDDIERRMCPFCHSIMGLILTVCQRNKQCECERKGEFFLTVSLIWKALLVGSDSVWLIILWQICQCRGNSSCWKLRLSGFYWFYRFFCPLFVHKSGLRIEGIAQIVKHTESNLGNWNKIDWVQLDVLIDSSLIC